MTLGFIGPRPRTSGDDSAILNVYIAALWPVLSTRDIASKLDMTTGAVTRRGDRLGLPSRPIGAQP